MSTALTLKSMEKKKSNCMQLVYSGISRHIPDVQLTPISLAYPSMNEKQKAKAQTTKLNPHSLNAIATRKDDVQFESTKQIDKKLIRRK